MLKSLFKWRYILVGFLLLLVPSVLAQEVDLCEDMDLIDYNDTYSGQIEDDFPFYVFCFEGEEDDEVTIIVETTDGDLVPYVFLANPVFDEDEDIEVFDEDLASDDNDEAEISVTLPDDGVYVIIVSREDTDQGDTEGEFEMNLEAEGDGSRNSTNNDDSDVENFCDEEPLATLSKYQYGIPSSNPNAPLVAYNVGCTGFIVSTIAGRSELGQYEVSRSGEMSFTIGGEVEFVSVEADDDEWRIEVVGGDRLTLERLEDDGCDDSPLEELVGGAWVGDDEFLLDFTCNGIVIRTEDGETTVGNYELDRSDINLEFESGDFVMEDFEVDDSDLSAEVDGDALEFVNVLD